MKKINQKGFTLIELLIVMAIISIIAAVVFVALDPLTRFRQSRDAARWTDISALVSAIKIGQVDNGGTYMPAVSGLEDNVTHMIGKATTGCNVTACGVAATADCVDLDNASTGLVASGYLGKIPVSPNGTGSWTDNLTGYTITRSPLGIITVRACEAESTTEIKVSR